MTRIIKFPGGEHDEKSDQIRVKREFCCTCGSGLDLWTDDDGTAFGVCNLCDLGVGAQPIDIVPIGEE
jgi:hypothetical protein